MGKIHLILALHQHQPVGNFENVFREAYEKCYEPFLKFLEDHPYFRACLHYSGCLFDWLEAREKKFLKRLAQVIRLNQVEILGGGYYEPILPLIPESDAVDQMEFMSRYLEKRFGARPRGLWLTERVWEQKIPRLTSQAGLEYTALDDTHFSLAGLSESEIKNYFITEEEGHSLTLFPVPKFLRYAIPFQEPHRSIDYLKELVQANEEERVVTYADDGEKFGLWPGTYQWVYRDGWLERFARTLEENRDWLALKTFGEVIDEKKERPLSKVYLPTASYEEMTEWALSRSKGLELAALKKEFEATTAWSRLRGYFQGGTFKNFLTKYSEADWMKTKMEWVSRKVAGTKNASAKKKAQQELWQGQCNCPYWHGVFGGLYLHHLRRSTYEHLIRAEKIITPSHPAAVRVIEEDINHDNAKEVILESDVFNFYFLPHRGGSLTELDFKPQTTNVLDVMTRRKETYHEELVARKGKENGKGKSIHELEKSVSPDTTERMAFDAWDRLSFFDCILPADTPYQDYQEIRFHSLIQNPAEIAFYPQWTRSKEGIALSLKGETPLAESEGRVVFNKSIALKSSGSYFEIHLQLCNQTLKTLNVLWGNEWNFNFFDKGREVGGAERIEIQDGWSPVHLEIQAGEAFDFWQYPIETIAQTESDFRLIHQGIMVFPHWKISLKPGQAVERDLTFYFSSR